MKEVKPTYESPVVRVWTALETEQAILAGSVAPDMQATSGSQKLEQVDAGDVTFNHEWN